MTVIIAATVSGLLLLGGTGLTVVINYLLAQQRQSAEDRKDLNVRVAVLESRALIQADYINTLRRHIEDGKPPPPPPYPEGLTR
jgi:hypothetical protein